MESPWLGELCVVDMLKLFPEIERLDQDEACLLILIGSFTSK
jgi:hypothetical protein